MSYTGEVHAGGPADTREVAGLRISKLSVGPFDNNCYLLECLITGTLVLVDAANDAPRLLAELAGRPLAGIVTTHQHGDHWQALADLSAATGARTYAHALDADALPVPPSMLLGDGDRLPVGEVTLGVIHLAGHTPGGLALLHDADADAPHLMTGDSLFPGGVGRTQSPEEFHHLLDDVERKVFGQLPDSTWIYPGHGKDTTLGAERPSLAEWRERGW